ncbi:uncharacterized protein LOC126262743 [Schistocerca nitens]|uniref:uncharacterized protein LOC126262743 n=1 Tax=Schistocerca nitens TaxID=7011 RepID=UPI00211801FB|nr:uncharacterized protein LOC126262743 [Schistocerca nitens]
MPVVRKDNGNATGGITIAVNDLVNKSEGLMGAFLSYLRGAQVHSGPHVPPNGTATNVIKRNTVTKTVFQHLAHEEHSNETVTTSSEHPTLSNGTKVTAKFEEKTTTASKIYAQFEAHNSTIQEYNETVHGIKFPPVRKFVLLPNNTLDYQKNSAAFAIHSPSGKPNNPFSIIFPLLHIGVAQSLMNPLTRINSLKHDGSTLPCLQSSIETGHRVKCLNENRGSLSGIYNKTNEIAHGNLAFRAQHVRVKRSSDFRPAYILATSAGESSRDVELQRPDGSGMDQQSQTSKFLPPNVNKPDFPADGTRWTFDDGGASRHHPGTDLLPRDFGLQARQAWGSMLGIMWCAAGVLFSGPSFWNVMACLLQAGQAFIG